MSNRPIANLIARIKGKANHPAFPILLGLLASLDFFILVVPTDGLLISAVLLRPKKWFSFAFWTTVGSTLGGTAFAICIEKLGPAFVEKFFGNAMHTEQWLQAAQWVDRWGYLALLGFAVTPIALQGPVAICAITKMSIFGIAACLIAGRGGKYVALTWICAKTPNWMKSLKPEKKP